MSHHQPPQYYGKENNVMSSRLLSIMARETMSHISLPSIVAKMTMSSLQSPQYYGEEDNVKPQVS